MKSLTMHCVVSISLALVGLFAAQGQGHAEDQGTAIANPCAGPSSLLAILDRPTVSDSACAVPSGQVIIEMGFQHVHLRGPGGSTADNYPDAEVRIGLADSNEFVLLPPNYNRQR